MEFRPRLGGWKSRWRLGTRLSFSKTETNIVEATQEDLTMSDMTVSPFSPRFVRMDATLQRNLRSERFRTETEAWEFSVGPEFELVNGGPLDLSVEAGYAYFTYRVRTVSELYQSSYLLFAPEVFVPDVDPARFLEGGDTPLTTRTTSDHQRHRLYAGVRAEVFPFQDHLGISSSFRWYTGNLPLTRTARPALSDPFDITASTKRWIVQFGITLGWTHTAD